MTEVGYKLSSEEHSAPDPVRYALRLYAAGAPEVGVRPEVTTTEVPALDEGGWPCRGPVYIRWLSEED